MESSLNSISLSSSSFIYSCSPKMWCLIALFSSLIAVTSEVSSSTLRRSSTLLRHRVSRKLRMGTCKRGGEHLRCGLALLSWVLVQVEKHLQ